MEYNTIQKHVNTAYDIWGKHKDWDMERFWLHLSYPQKVAVFCGKLNEQVENGGFRQWDDNGYSECSSDLIKILLEIDGCKKIIHIIQQALDVLYDSKDCTVCKSEHCLKHDEKLNELDGQYYDVKPQLLDIVEEYLIQYEKDTSNNS